MLMPEHGGLEHRHTVDILTGMITGRGDGTAKENSLLWKLERSIGSCILHRNASPPLFFFGVSGRRCERAGRVMSFVLLLGRSKNNARQGEWRRS